MGPALDDYLTVVAPHLHEDLVPAPARACLHDLARHLPVSDLAGLECGLGEARSRVDLIVRLPRARFDLPEPLASDPVWRRVRGFASRLRDPASLLARAVNVLGVEFDVPDGLPQVPVPAIFFELNRGAELRAEHAVALAAELVARPLSRNAGALLRRCVEARPAGSRMFQLGAMLSRPGDSVRVVVSRVPAARVVGYLRDVGWGGDGEVVGHVVAALADRVESFALSMDVAGAVHPRVGLECYLGAGPGRLRAGRALLERLDRFALCTPAKARALLAWHGVCQEATCPESWPRHLLWGDRLLGARATSVIVRSIGHVKVVVQPAAPLEAKGYLGFAHYWLARGTGREPWATTA